MNVGLFTCPKCRKDFPLHVKSQHDASCIILIGNASNQINNQSERGANREEVSESLFPGMRRITKRVRDQNGNVISETINDYPYNNQDIGLTMNLSFNPYQLLGQNVSQPVNSFQGNMNSINMHIGLNNNQMISNSFPFPNSSQVNTSMNINPPQVSMQQNANPFNAPLFQLGQPSVRSIAPNQRPFSSSFNPFINQPSNNVPFHNGPSLAQQNPFLNPSFLPRRSTNPNSIFNPFISGSIRQNAPMSLNLQSNPYSIPSSNSNPFQSNPNPFISTQQTQALDTSMNLIRQNIDHLESEVNQQLENINHRMQSMNNQIEPNAFNNLILPHRRNHHLFPQRSIAQNESNNPVAKHLLDALPEIQIKDVFKLEEEKRKCSICLSEFINEEMILPLPCLHFYHSECILDWFKKQNTCPLCKTVIDDSILKD